MSRAQLFSIDFIVAAAVFMGTLILLGYSWHTVITERQVDYALDEMQTLTYSVSNTLIRIPGTPKYWSKDNVEVFGLAIEDHVLNRTKVENFVDMTTNNYTLVREKLGLSRYEFYVNITYTNNTPIYEQDNIIIPR